MIARRLRSLWGFVIPLAIVAWMGIENFDDHDRTDRYAARNFAANLLNTLEPDAVIFVNGDNYTFPLWYAQEVEGIRRDVRVVNLAYLNTTVYAANLMKDWRDSKALPMTLTRGDIIWEAFRMTKIRSGATDTIPATDALDSLRNSPVPEFPTRYVTLHVSSDSTIVYDLHNLKKKGASLDFSRLMMFDIIATGGSSPHKRPIYWLYSISADKRIGLTNASSPWLFGYRFGIMSQAKGDSMLSAEARRVIPANPPGRDVYMDHVPAAQIASQRGAMTAAAIRLLHNGRLGAAIEMAERADRLMGQDAGTFVNTVICDSTFSTRRELGKLLLECADSLEAHATAGDISSGLFGKTAPETRIAEFRARGNHHLREYRLQRAAWQNYRRHLPPRLRNKMSPTY